jgi:hypothetical protein
MYFELPRSEHSPGCSLRVPVGECVTPSSDQESYISYGILIYKKMVFSELDNYSFLDCNFLVIWHILPSFEPSEF